MAQTLQTARLVSLAEVIATAPAEHVLATGFHAQLTAPLVGGEIASHGVVKGTVGERTVVVELEDGERWLARIPDVLVDPDALEWVREGRPPRGRWTGKHPDEDVAEELGEQRRASDKRALQDQERRRQPGVPDAGARGRFPMPVPIEAGDGVVEPSTTAAADGVPAGEAAADQVGTDVDAVRQVDENRPVELAEGDATAPAGRTEVYAPAVSSPPADPGPAPTSSPELAPSPTVGTGAGDCAAASPGEAAPQPVEQDGSSGTAASPGRPACALCRRPLGGRNRAGVCGSCQTTCPRCGGPKAPPAERCRACRWTEPERRAEAACAGPTAATGDSVATGVQHDDGAAEGRGDQVDVDLMTAEEGEEAPRPGHVAVARRDPPDDFVEPEGPRRCSICDQQLPRHNRKGICTACQSKCPSCGGAKAPQAERCRACGREESRGPVSAALSFAAAMEDLPDMVRELREQLVAVSEYARSLEDELADQRSAERRRATRLNAQGAVR